MIKFIILLMSGYIYAIDYSTPSGVKGYWNYEITAKTNTITNTFTIKPMPATPVLMRMHPEEIQKLIKDWRKHAIYTLNPHDVSEYLRIQDVARKKAAAFAAITGLVNQTNPNLSLNDELPTTNTARQVKYNERKQALEQYISKAIKNYGLIYFTSKTCEFCRIQDDVLKQLLNEFNFDIKVFEMSKHPIFASKFNIKQTPTILLVGRNSTKWIPVTFGATSLPALKENIYRGIRYIQKEITPAQFFTNEKDIGSGLDPLNKQQQ